MNKILLLPFLLFTGFYSYNQETHHVSTIVTGTWSKYSENWSFDNGKDADMTITVNGNKISMSNNTTITTSDVISRNNNGREIKTFYNAIDQNREECTLILATSIGSGKQTISVMYLRSIILVFYLD